jgi:hypothetical protein
VVIALAHEKEKSETCAFPLPAPPPEAEAELEIPQENASTSISPLCFALVEAPSISSILMNALMAIVFSYDLSVKTNSTRPAASTGRSR